MEAAGCHGNQKSPSIMGAAPTPGKLRPERLPRPDTTHALVASPRSTAPGTRTAGDPASAARLGDGAALRPAAGLGDSGALPLRPGPETAAPCPSGTGRATVVRARAGFATGRAPRP
ncbi:hypothetical protein GCM10007977_058780 [Dactylosporangium sucinum]|uniref:Uncharacterized protein n=1 Tax=Dactylosporangium sucinum TaxID=1424081 RepID=A0A917U0T5_9ACTN|nr:hypothetical protein GCM10007977_058780 [Dactylosporangium sucinum]